MAYASQANNPARLIGIGIVIVMHIGIVIALKEGLSRSIVELVKGPIETKIIEEIKEEKKLPPPPPANPLKPPPVYVPPIDTPMIDLEPAPDTRAITSTTSQKPVKQAPAIPGTPIQLNRKRTLSKPHYPPSSMRLGEEGLVTINLCVGENGKITDAKLVKTSGFPKLDAAAIEHALSGAWDKNFNPATQNGKPITACSNVPVRFKIENER